jgi:hypothetical protein
MLLAGAVALPVACAKSIGPTVQRRAEDLSACSFLKNFEDNCLAPVLGAYGTFEAKTNMEGACEVIFWGLKANGVPEVRRYMRSAPAPTPRTPRPVSRRSPLTPVIILDDRKRHIPTDRFNCPVDRSATARPTRRP